MVEVKNRRKLSKGLQALGIRLAKSLNSLWRRKKGTVFAERYFAAAIENWRQMWRTIRYVLGNGRKHGSWTVKGQPDPYSSGRWYLPWKLSNIRRPLRSSPVMEAIDTGIFIPWIGIDDVPGPRWQEAEYRGSLTCSVSSLAGTHPPSSASRALLGPGHRVARRGFSARDGPAPGGRASSKRRREAGRPAPREAPSAASRRLFELGRPTPRAGPAPPAPMRGPRRATLHDLDQSPPRQPPTGSPPPPHPGTPRPPCTTPASSGTPHRCGRPR